MNYDEALPCWAAGTPLKTSIDSRGSAYLRIRARDRLSFLETDDQQLEDYLYNKSVYLSLRHAAGFNDFGITLSIEFCSFGGGTIHRHTFALLKENFSWEFNL